MKGTRLALPSRGRYGEYYVDIKRPTVGDLVDYLQAGDSSFTAKINFVSELAGFDFSDYPEGDLEHVFVSIRSLVNTSTVAGSIVCGCTEPVYYFLELSKCQVDMLPDDFEPNYEFTFPVSGVKRKLNLLTVKKKLLMEDYLRFYQYSDYPLLHTDLGDNLEEFAKYACMLDESDSLEGIDKNITFLRNLDWTDFEKIVLYAVMFPCGPVVAAKAKCSKCEKNYNIRIRTDASFFGLTLEGLLGRHRFLARTAHIGFNDFLSYTMPVLNKVATAEIEREQKVIEIKKKNNRRR